jgi:hypothetical protein
MSNILKTLVAKPQGKLSCKQEHDIKMDHREIGGEAEDWMKVARIGCRGGVL